MRILFVSSDQGGCRYYRCLLPAQELSRQGGHEVLVAGSLAQLRSGEIVAPSADDPRTFTRGFELVVLQRWMHQDAAEVTRMARAYGQIVINDVDDWFFGIPTSNAAFRGSHKSNDPTWNIEHYRRVLAASSALTVSTPYLAERLTSLGRPVYTIRNHIDIERWTPATVAPRSLVLGWVGHMAHRAAGDLGQLAGVLGPWMSRYQHARFLHAGSDGEADHEAMLKLLAVTPDRLMTRGLRNIRFLPQLIHGMDIGLAPLEECPFNFAKSNVKVLEYGAAGVPAIASDRPEYRQFGAVALCKTASDWTAALDRLADPGERLAAAVAARARAREFDIRAGWSQWESVYERVIADAKGESLGSPSRPSLIVPASSFRRRKPKRRART